MAERAPSWIELMGRHAASSSLFVSAVLRYESRPERYGERRRPASSRFDTAR
ncbi:hypothetical protein GS592_25730 [Rhodococcus hoagii]|nr:hypothetical protein [Prescottella equi]